MLYANPLLDHGYQFKTRFQVLPTGMPYWICSGSGSCVGWSHPYGKPEPTLRSNSRLLHKGIVAASTTLATLGERLCSHPSCLINKVEEPSLPHR
jgi:hypothetical protein